MSNLGARTMKIKSNIYFLLYHFERAWLKKIFQKWVLIENTTQFIYAIDTCTFKMDNLMLQYFKRKYENKTNKKKLFETFDISSTKHKLCV